jgi:hypothetical protein
MADTGGIAALLKALDGSPGLGAGLKPSARPTARTGDFAAAAGVSRTPATTIDGPGAAAPAATLRPVRTTTRTAPPPKPSTVIAEGKAYDAKAPRGSYLDIVI